MRGNGRTAAPIKRLCSSQYIRRITIACFKVSALHSLSDSQPLPAGKINARGRRRTVWLNDVWRNSWELDQWPQNTRWTVYCTKSRGFRTALGRLSVILPHQLQPLLDEQRTLRILGSSFQGNVQMSALGGRRCTGEWSVAPSAAKHWQGCPEEARKRVCLRERSVRSRITKRSARLLALKVGHWTDWPGSEGGHHHLVPPFGCLKSGRGPAGSVGGLVRPDGGPAPWAFASWKRVSGGVTRH